MGYIEHLQVIEAHAFELSEARGELVTLPDATRDWYAESWLPAIEAIETSGMNRTYDFKTDGDRYLWTYQKLRELRPASSACLSSSSEGACDGLVAHGVGSPRSAMGNALRPPLTGLGHTRAMSERHCYRVVATPEDGGHTIRLVVPELADTSTVALDLVEGEVLVRQAIAMATDADDPNSFDVDLVEATPGHWDQGTVGLAKCCAVQPPPTELHAWGPMGGRPASRPSSPSRHW
jgi:hypothetical protein